jgi:hypothetical protein
VFGFWASSGKDAQDPVKYVNNLARDEGVKFIIFLTNTTFPYTTAIRMLVPGVFTRVICMRVVEIAGKTIVPAQNVYADVRDRACTLILVQSAKNKSDIIRYQIIKE